jgi:hypothetical protein
MPVTKSVTYISQLSNICYLPKAQARRQWLAHEAAHIAANLQEASRSFACHFTPFVDILRDLFSSGQRRTIGC